MKKIYYLYAWIFGRPSLSRINHFIYALALRALGVYNYTSIKISGEKWLLDNIVKALGKELVVFDVGANIGNYTIDIIEAGVDTKKIFAFEPHPKTFAVLKENMSMHHQVFPVLAALSDQEGEMLLFDRSDSKEGSSHASLSGEIFSEIHKIGKTERAVQVKTLDNFCADNNVNIIDFIKIDVEGFELNVLRGAHGMLTNRKIRVIQFEFTQLNSIIGVFFKEIYDIVSINYDVYRVLPHGLDKICKYNPTKCEIFGYQNFVAILKDDF